MSEVIVNQDAEIANLEQDEFWLFMFILVLMGSIFAVNTVRLCYNVKYFHVADQAMEEFNMDQDNYEMRLLVENHKQYEGSYGRILLPRGG